MKQRTRSRFGINATQGSEAMGSETLRSATILSSVSIASFVETRPCAWRVARTLQKTPGCYYRKRKNATRCVTFELKDHPWLLARS